MMICTKLVSFPTRERGLKQFNWITMCLGQEVVPYAGTWIETSINGRRFIQLNVVPYAGTWIETLSPTKSEKCLFVVPYAGTWIETSKSNPHT